MNVDFRVDSSRLIGTGHVMRCLTLAEALRKEDAVCRFICRNHPGNLINEIKRRGFDVLELKFDGDWTNLGISNSEHASWLGADWQTDAEQTKACAGVNIADWLIVDHYAIDSRWEFALAMHYRKIMVIDDLADRPHFCDLLLDQTFGRDPTDYRPLVPEYSKLLCGSSFAILRPEFSAIRPYSLNRRIRPSMKELLITLGGVDKDNLTCSVMQVLGSCPIPRECKITVVMGETAPWLDKVRAQAQDMNWHTRVLCGVKNMAELMANSDLAIGAAGSTSWERCCLGLPTIMLTLANNQIKIAHSLNQIGAVSLFDISKLGYQQLITTEQLEPQYLKNMSLATASITDGLGTGKITELLIN